MTKEIDRYRGALIGLAVGDAVGTALEFREPGTFTPIADMVGGGPFHLRAGMWTDDTSMALCLADSLVEMKGFDPVGLPPDRQGRGPGESQYPPSRSMHPLFRAVTRHARELDRNILVR